MAFWTKYTPVPISPNKCKCDTSGSSEGHLVMVCLLWIQILTYAYIWRCRVACTINNGQCYKNFQLYKILGIELQWRHNERDGVASHQPHHCLLNRLFKHRSEKTSKLRVIGLCGGNSPVTGWASNAENISIWWHHHGISALVFSTLVMTWICFPHYCSTGTKANNTEHWLWWHLLCKCHRVDELIVEMPMTLDAITHK